MPPLYATEAPLPHPMVAARAEPSAIFAPPLDRTLTYRTELRREGDRGPFRLTLSRELSFRRDGAGYLATLVLRTADGEGDGASRALAGLAPFIAVPIRFHLDAGGTIKAVESRDLLWQLFCNGIAVQAKGDATQRHVAKLVLEKLRDAPAAQRTAMFADMLAPVLASHAAARGVGPDSAVTAPADPTFGASATLSGHRRTWREGAALIVSTHLEGDVGAPAGGAGSEIHIVRDTRTALDPATGIVGEQRQTTIRRTGDGTIRQSVVYSLK
ncbi:hypothetical protein KY084_03135 [Stakelama sp. CBK3Z-3]|uniref:Uncharacterized protein n=1 Tax=Stakelama flava TaxID=2860338 RepID=A0ABS6XI51_9SPHN|nr:hypothetical protein [Stakelama flava]MBW4329868.1 hypothetical protein [Stakelama flava]